ncbi:hypothetical protein CLAFUW4_06156 [Fulvia fulva]|uniref:Uncharacterized protein n=1 Tax=Passalora fulva TaxID=5499 RepID=A0A9Q8LJY5_PASFU|nr:uncharacterized protein CLAFUR5_06300 [Fulvia fulva]KAK4623932.1 hypothetical protein CLAFUR4_06159 [Fulvia fulva]KAK4625885.1 hypothetical protein CLAFUR0_06163 [Fulvia fulva]UJO18083.1 hypothetical protein CLAFUR5_06300 [Fulvia fulva]WPV14684.1 hypothetical protein CLAFUW4_06156 [Fulvia fulva]WPV29375.1 hypothetical protein CLAFUW7_06152 [Fulvia fulva]
MSETQDTAASPNFALLDIDMHTLITRDFTFPASISEKEQEFIAHIRKALRDMITAINDRNFSNEVFARILGPKSQEILGRANIRGFAQDEPTFWIKLGTVSVVPDVRKNTAQTVYAMELHGVPERVTRPAVTQQEWKKSAADGRSGTAQCAQGTKHAVSTPIPVRESS